MRSQTTPAGAMPVAVSAMLTQSYPSGPVFAAYRLPHMGAPGAREAGVCFEGQPPAGGATPPAGDPPPTPPIPPAGGPPATPPTPPTPPATGGPDVLGEPGKRALEAERARAEKAEKELRDLKLAGASEAEKAIAAARTEGEDKYRGQLHAVQRQHAVEKALTLAGITPDLIADATKADEFTALKVGDDNQIDPRDVEAAVKAHKARVPSAYKPAAGGAPSAHTEGGHTDGQAGGAKPNLTSALEAHYAPKSS